MSPFDADHFTDMDGNEHRGRRRAEPCPFCGSGADQLVVERWSREGTLTHVECLKCGCNGPQADSQPEAAQAWNGRST